MSAGSCPARSSIRKRRRHSRCRRRRGPSALLGLVDPHVGRQIRMRVLDALIDDRHGQRRIARGEFPRLLHVDIRSGARRFGKYSVAVVAVVPLVLAQPGSLKPPAAAARVAAEPPCRDRPLLSGSQLQFALNCTKLTSETAASRRAAASRSTSSPNVTIYHLCSPAARVRSSATGLQGTYAAQRSDASCVKMSSTGAIPERVAAARVIAAAAAVCSTSPDGIAVEIDQQFAPRGIRGSIDDLAHGGRRSLPCRRRSSIGSEAQPARTAARAVKFSCQS